MTKCASQDYRFASPGRTCESEFQHDSRRCPLGMSDGLLGGGRRGRKRTRDKRRSVSLCSLRSLRASMCQLFKIHKARGECQERTKLNDSRANSPRIALCLSLPLRKPRGPRVRPPLRKVSIEGGRYRARTLASLKHGNVNLIIANTSCLTHTHTFPCNV